MIPKRILCGGKSLATLGKSRKKHLEAIKRLHPDWEVLFFSEGDSEHFIKSRRPELAGLYEWYPVPGMKSDVFRVAAVETLGGFYVDLDLQMTAPLDELLGRGLVFAREREPQDRGTKSRQSGAQAKGKGGRQLGNYAFGGVKGHPFLGELIREMVARTASVVEEFCRPEDASAATGSGLLTFAYYKHRKSFDDIHILKDSASRREAGIPDECDTFGKFGGLIPPPDDDSAEDPPAISGLQERRVDIIAYTYSADCGLGEAAVENIQAMRASGFTVEHRILGRERFLKPEASLKDPRQIYYHHWHPQAEEKERDWQMAGFAGPDGARHIGYWAYEVEGGLPLEFHALAPWMSEIWTPSTFCRRLFETVNRPVHVVPHAVSALKTLPGLPVSLGESPLVILYLFDAWSRFARKNPAAVIRVFQKAFPTRRDVRLVLKAHHMDAAGVRDLNRLCSHDSRIQIINRFLSHEELERVFAGADIFLGLQKSEGFGLNIAKALGMGLPVITTGWGGHLDFCNPGNSYLVPYSIQRVGQSRDPLYRKGTWAHPDETAAAAILLKVAGLVAKGDKSLRMRRENGRREILEKFSPKSLIHVITGRLASLTRTPTS